MYDIIFTGDTFLTNKCIGKSPFSNSIGQLFNDSDYICINLETTIGTEGTKIAKAYNFQAPPSSLRYLTENNIEICSLANNHSLDYGGEGLEKTIEHLRSYNISYIGTEECNQKDLLINNNKLRICSYYGNYKGLARINSGEIIADIKRHKRDVDFLLVCLHWGEEYVAYPSRKQQQMAHSLIDAGADVVIGHHPHVIQGSEQYHNGLIFYSLGNFNFFVDHPYANKLIETRRAYCVGLRINADSSIDYHIIPLLINENWQPEIITDQKELERFYNYFDSISEPLKRDISKIFYLSEVAPHYFKNHLPSWIKRIRNYGVSHFFQMIKWLIHPFTYKYYLGLFISLISFFNKKARY